MYEACPTTQYLLEGRTLGQIANGIVITNTRENTSLCGTEVWSCTSTVLREVIRFLFILDAAYIVDVHVQPQLRRCIGGTYRKYTSVDTNETENLMVSLM